MHGGARGTRLTLHDMTRSHVASSCRPDHVIDHRFVRTYDGTPRRERLFSEGYVVSPRHGVGPEPH